MLRIVLLLSGCIFFAALFEFYKVTSSIHQYIDVWQNEIVTMSFSQNKDRLHTKLITQIEEIHPAIKLMQSTEEKCLLPLSKRMQFYNLPAQTLTACRHLDKIFIYSLFSVQFVFLLFLVTLFSAWLYIRQQREKANEELSLLARQVAHDIRGPVSALQVLIKKNQSLPQSDLEILEHVGARILSVAQDLLTKSKKRTLPEQTFHHFHVDEALKTLLPELKMRFADVIFEVSFQANAEIQFDRNDLKRIISNLVQNAVEASKAFSKIEAQKSLDEKAMDSGQIKVSLFTRQLSSQVQITVVDQGQGMSADLLEQIGKKEISTKAEGNGLALKDAFNKVATAGGKINILSRLGQGTQVSLTFPLHRS